MAFIIDNNDNVVSFAEVQDVINADQRLFEANEGLTDENVEAQLIRATERVLDKFRSSSWWRDYYNRRNPVTNPAAIPALDPKLIRDRQNDFTDLCVYTALSEYILPSIADFSNEDSSERQKMKYYTNKAETMFSELINAGDWYDFDNTGTVTDSEKSAGQYNPKRIR